MPITRVALCVQVVEVGAEHRCTARRQGRFLWCHCGGGGAGSGEAGAGPGIASENGPAQGAGPAAVVEEAAPETGVPLANGYPSAGGGMVEEGQTDGVAVEAAPAADATAPGAPAAADDTAPESQPVAAAAPAPVPARLLYGYTDDAAPEPDGQARREQHQQQRQRTYPPSGVVSLPAYAADDGSWEQFQTRSEGFQPTEMFIGGLLPTADEYGVWQAVVPHGEVVSVKLIKRKRDRGDCRGYGER